jgi:hypothetical protein
MQSKSYRLFSSMKKKSSNMHEVASMVQRHNDHDQTSNEINAAYSLHRFVI